jgi:lipopolysaccharide transport system ATP-binding protein
MKWFRKLFASRSDRSYDLVVLDDFFPNLLTGFRVAEYTAYLRHFPNLHIFSTYSDFKGAHSEFSFEYPELASRVSPYSELALEGCKLAYINFLNNAYQFQADLEKHKVPFLLNLYPGGGFGIDEPESDRKLRSVLASSMLRYLFTTQRCSTSYLSKFNVSVPQIEVFGGVIPDRSRAKSDVPRFGNSSPATKVCFVAQKYMPLAANKGLPEFAMAMELLLDQGATIQVTIVGNYDSNDHSLFKRYGGYIAWRGSLTAEELTNFYLSQDVVVSPNRPFILSQGNFDGFPTGACVEASFCGVAMVVSDPLSLNEWYRDGHEIVICSTDPADIAAKVRELVDQPNKRIALANAGRARTQMLFSDRVQLEPRIAAIEKYYALTFEQDS